MDRIVAHYFPRGFDVESMLARHLDQDSCVHIAEQKDKIITEDDLEHGKKQVDELTKEYTDNVDRIIKSKSDEIMLD